MDAADVKQEARGPLSDIRVIDVATAMGQYIGKLLADMGADVIKVEPPGGDEARRLGPFAGDIADPERSLSFCYYNTSKRGVTLDIRNRRGQELLRRLVASADVLVETFHPGYLEGLGLGYEALSEVNPRLIMTSLTGFGQTGPYRDFLTSDLVALAMGGPMASCGYDDIPGAPPIRGSGGQGYHTGCHYAAIGTLLALVYRDATGLGQHVDASLHEALACTTEAAMPYWFYSHKPPIRQTGRHHALAPTPPTQHPTRDGLLVCTFGLPRSLSGWINLVKWLDSYGMAEDLGDPKYRDLILQSVRSGPMVAHITEVMRRFIATLTADEAYRGAQEIGLPWGIVRSPEETLDDPHLWDRGFFVSVEHPEMAEAFTYPGAPYIFSETPWRLRRRSPLIGEDNEAVYLGELGLSREEMKELGREEVI